MNDMEEEVVRNEQGRFVKGLIRSYQGWDQCPANLDQSAKQSNK